MSKYNKLVKTNGEYYECYLLDYHGEHPIPTFPNVIIREHWNGYMIRRAFKLAFKSLRISNINQLMQTDFLKETKGCFEEVDTDYGHVWHITIVGEENILPYIKYYQQQIIKAIENTGGDDDFYDYMPNFVDTFYQLCKLFNQLELFEATLAPYRDHPREYEFYN